MNKVSSFLKANAPTLILVFISFLLLSFLHKHRLEVHETFDSPNISAKDSPAYIDDTEEEIIKNKINKHPWIGLVFLLVLGGGVWANGYIFKRKLKHQSLLPGPKPVLAGQWGLREVFFVFVLLYFLEVLCLFVEYSIFKGQKLTESTKDKLTLINTLIRDVGGAIYLIWVIRHKLKLAFASIGLESKKIGQHILTGVFAYLAVFPWLLIILALMSWLTQVLNYEAPAQPALEMFFKKSMEDYMIFFSLFVAVLGPAIEEIFFRGFAYTALRTRFGVRWGLLLSALIFALLHFNLLAFFPIFILGLYLAYLYEKSGSLIPSMTVHILHNFLMVIITLSIKFTLS